MNLVNEVKNNNMTDFPKDYKNYGGVDIIYKQPNSNSGKTQTLNIKL